MADVPEAVLVAIDNVLGWRGIEPNYGEDLLSWPENDYRQIANAVLNAVKHDEHVGLLRRVRNDLNESGMWPGYVRSIDNLLVVKP